MPNDVMFLSNRIPRSVARGFVLLGLLRCDIHVVQEHINGNSFPYECDTKYLPYIRIIIQCDLANHLVNLATPVSRNRKQ
jgi:hypothetical protein